MVERVDHNYDGQRVVAVNYTLVNRNCNTVTL